uniref:Uncharacterized protein n=1 Tax=Caenorhabditis tropicalis TaxID=1561998 RepID=A0A1I7THQ2_9PELO
MYINTSFPKRGGGSFNTSSSSPFNPINHHHPPSSPIPKERRHHLVQKPKCPPTIIRLLREWSKNGRSRFTGS